MSVLFSRIAMLGLLIWISCVNALASGEKVIHKFTGSPDGRTPLGALVADKDGNLYGTAFFGGIPSGGGSNPGFGLVFKFSPPATQGGTWTETTIYSFTGGSDGGGPNGTLIFDDKGNLYGGRNGGIFELSPPTTPGDAWTETNLPSPGSQQGSKLLFYLGNFYGVTQDGGTAKKGTAFVLKPPPTAGGAWTYRVLHNFGVTLGDGTVPMAGLTLHNGSLYGTTNQGGASLGGCGVVFELTPKNGVWTYTILYDFIANENGGGAPFGPLVFDPAGNIYGTTSGESMAFPNPGGVYELSPPTIPGNPWQETILSNFTDGTNGITPMAGVIRDAANNLYGTTYYGGGTHSLGVVFKLKPPKVAGGTWTEVVLRKFAGAPSDGAHPNGELILLNGTLYGTTLAGGVAVCCSDMTGGTMFSLVP